MNFITYWKAYCLYPRLSFGDRVALLTDKIGGTPKTLRQIKAKYAKRKWGMEDGHDALRLRRSPRELKSRTRRIGDSDCWTITLKDGYSQDDVFRVERISWKQSVQISFESIDTGMDGMSPPVDIVLHVQLTESPLILVLPVGN